MMLMLVLYAMLATSFWYLGSRALVTRALWTRYPRWLATFMDCPACTGFWWGLILALTARFTTWLPSTGFHPIFVGIACIFLVAVGAGIMQRALFEAGTVIGPSQSVEDTWQRIE